jgi:hypothetical protein
VSWAELWVGLWVRLYRKMMFVGCQVSRITPISESAGACLLSLLLSIDLLYAPRIHYRIPCGVNWSETDMATAYVLLNSTGFRIILRPSRFLIRPG